MCSLDQEKVSPRFANAEITDFNFKRNNTLTCSAICRSLLVSCPPGTMVSSFRRSLLSLLAATCSAVSSDRRLAILSWFRARLVSARTGVSWERWAARFLAVTDPPFLRSRMHTLWCLTRLVFASVWGFITSSIGNTKGNMFTKKVTICISSSSTFCRASSWYWQRVQFHPFLLSN